MKNTAYMKYAAILSCFVLAATANADTGNKNPRNTPVHPETSPVYGGLNPVSHSFSANELKRLVADTKNGVIVHHGEPRPPSGFSRVYTHLELVQPVGGKATKRVSLSRNDLEDILSGSIGNWAKVGGPDTTITIHAHNGHVNRQALEWQFERNGLTLGTTVHLHDSYDALAEAVSNDPGAMGFGLRSDARFRDGIVDMALQQGVFSSQRVAIFVRNDSEAAAEMGKALVDIVIARLAEDYSATPAERPEIDAGS